MNQGAEIGNIVFNDMKVVNDGRTVSMEDTNLAEHLNVAGDAQREGNFERADEVLRQVFADHALIELPIEVLCPLTTRALNVLYNKNIYSLVDLVQCKLSDVRHWYNFGTVSRSILGERMRAFGLNLAEQHDYTWIKSLDNRKTKRLDRLLVLPTFLHVSAVNPLSKCDHFDFRLVTRPV